MEKSVDLGKEAQLVFEIKDNKIQIKTAYAGKYVAGGAFVAMTPEQLCSGLADLIPGDSGLEKGFIGALRMGLEMSMTTTDPVKVAKAMDAGKDLQKPVEAQV